MAQSTETKLNKRFDQNIEITGTLTVGGNSVLTSYTETDPIFQASPASGITTTNISNWNTAYNWGDWSIGVNKAFVDALNVDANTVDSKHATDFTLQYITDNGNDIDGNIVFGATAGYGINFGGGGGGTLGYIQEISAGQIKFGSDDKFEFYETDSDVLRVDWSMNNGTFNFIGSLREDGYAVLHAGNYTTYTDNKYLRSDESDTMSGILTINRITGQPSLKSGNDHFVIDSQSSSNAVFLQNYVGGNVYMVTGGGRVGVGTTSPDDMFHIERVDNDTRYVRSYMPSSTTYNAGTTNTEERVAAGLRFGWYSEYWQVGVARGASTDADGLIFSKDGTEVLVLDNSGNIGINNVSPNYKLDIKTTSTEGAQIALRNTSTGSAGIYFDASNGDLVGSDYWWIGQQNDLDFHISGSSSAGNLIFKTGDSEQMRISSSGNIGIGISPSKKFHIAGNVLSTKYICDYTTAVIEATDARLQLCATNGGSNAAAILLSNESNHWAMHHRTSNLGNYLAFGYSTTTSTTDIVASCMSGIALAMTTSGRVGIGTENPTTKLDVTDTSTNPALTITSDGNNEQLRIRRYSNTNEQLILGFHSGDYGKIQAVEQGVAYRNLVLNASGGNVGIGRTTVDYKLDVAGNGIRLVDDAGNTPKIILAEDSTNNHLIMEYDGALSGAGNYLAFYSGVDSWVSKGGSLNIVPYNGYVGIGTVTPQKPFHVANGTALFNVSDDWQQSTYGTTLFRGGNFESSITANTNTIKIFPATSSRVVGDYWGGIEFMHLDPENSGWGTSYTGAQMWIGGRLIDTPGQERSAFVIATNNGTTAGTHPIERVTVLPNGLVGVNKSDPTYTLDVGGYARLHANSTPTLRLETTNSSTYRAEIQARYSYAEPFWITAYSGHKVIGTRTGSSYLDFYTGNGARATLTSTGLGIGTTEPSQKLHVIGRTQIEVAQDDVWMDLINSSEAEFRLRTYNNGTNEGTSAYAFKHGLYYNGTENAAVTFWRGGSSIGGFLSFTTNNGTMAMTIDSSQRVGIGTSSPSAVLHVARKTSQYTLKLGRASGVATIKSDGEDDGHMIIDSADASHAVWLQNYTSGNVYLATGGGKVGIGTTSLSEKLQVNGNILAWNGVGNSAKIRLNISNAGSPQIDLSDHNNDCYWAVGADDADNYFKIHGSTSSMPTINSIGTSAFLTVNTSGTLTMTGDVVAYSDERLKENIETIPNALEIVNKIRGVYYNRIDVEDKSRKVGVIAQEVEKVLPEVVTTYSKKDDTRTVAYGNIVGVLIEAVKELSNKVEELENKLNGTEHRN